jgi:UV DNA damage endonuclease
MAIKIGYPCINLTLECSGNKTFRLKSYSPEKLIQTVTNNLNCLFDMLVFNQNNNIKFFRISSDLIPFASHPICTFNWQNYFKNDFKKIGTYINENDMRISMHPDQFIILNAKDMKIVNRSIKELEYHAELLDLLGLNSTAKIQLHVGGVYNDKSASIERFIKQYNKLSPKIKKRLVIENDDKSYSTQDCLEINRRLGIPILFDVFHHILNNNGEAVAEALKSIYKTWGTHDGCPMIDYSSQQSKGKKGQHTAHIDLKDFNSFMEHIKASNVDIMLEIKDKEQSAIKAIRYLQDTKKSH